MRIRTVELDLHVGQHDQLSGWLQARRRIGGITFLILRDGWGTAQIALEDRDAAERILGDSLMNGTVLNVVGLVVESAQAPGGVEVHHPQLEVLVPVREAMPLSLHRRELKAGLATVLDHAVLANRRPDRQSSSAATFCS